MSHNFKVGEMAIVAFWPNGEFCVGDEVVILQVQAEPTFPQSPYVVKVEEGPLWRTVHICGDMHLRKKHLPPEGDSIATWRECPWQPAAVAEAK